MLEKRFRVIFWPWPGFWHQHKQTVFTNNRFTKCFLAHGVISFIPVVFKVWGGSPRGGARAPQVRSGTRGKNKKQQPVNKLHLSQLTYVRGTDWFVTHTHSERGGRIWCKKGEEVWRWPLHKDHKSAHPIHLHLPADSAPWPWMKATRPTGQGCR